MRADQLLVQRGLAASRAQAQRLIASGVEADPGSGWRRIAKNGEDLDPGIALRLLDDVELRWASRGGLKLDAALDATGFDVRGLDCLDVGQGSGGFTDCLLSRGAARVVGVDVGHRQLHPRLAADPRVIGLEGVNARHLTASGLIAAQIGSMRAKGRLGAENEAEPVREFGFVTGDLSFISLTLVLPALLPLLAARAALLLLVKPQFELQPAQIGKGGIVRDPALYARVEQRLRAACEALGLDRIVWFESAIRGGDGNREFFVFARKPFR